MIQRAWRSSDGTAWGWDIGPMIPMGSSPRPSWTPDSMGTSADGSLYTYIIKDTDLKGWNRSGNKWMNRILLVKRKKKDLLEGGSVIVSANEMFQDLNFHSKLLSWPYLFLLLLNLFFEHLRKVFLVLVFCEAADYGYLYSTTRLSKWLPDFPNFSKIWSKNFKKICLLFRKYGRFSRVRDTYEVPRELHRIC